MRRSSDLLCLSILIGICLLLGLPRYTSNLDPSDEGLLAYGGVRVMHGQAPHRDFVTLQGPLSFYTVAMLFRLFGASLLVLRVFGVAIYILIALLVYGLSRRFAGKLTSLAAALTTTVLGINYFTFVPYAIWQGIVASLIAGLLFLKAVECEHSRHWRIFSVMAGLACAASLVLRQDLAIYLIVAIFAYSVALSFATRGKGNSLNPMELLLFCFIGMFAVLLPLIVYWVTAGILPDLFRQLVLFPLTTYSKTSSVPFPRLASAGSMAQKALAVAYFVPPAIDLVMALWLGRKVQCGQFSPREAGILFLLVWSILDYAMVLTRSDYHHLLTTLPPFFVLCACGWDEFLKWITRLNGPEEAAASRRKWLASISAAALLLTFLCLVKPIMLQPPLDPSQTVQLQNAGVRKAGARNLEKFVRLVQDHAPADRSILCLPYAPMFYFLCERRNPTRWNYLWPGDQTAADHQALITQAKADPPAVIIIENEENMRRFAPDILQYIHQNYTRFKSAGTLFTIYLPGAP